MFISFKCRSNYNIINQKAKFYLKVLQLKKRKSELKTITMKMPVVIKFDNRNLSSKIKVLTTHFEEQKASAS